MINLYYALVYPYLLYGILVWGGASEIYLEPLALLQKKIIRIITSSDFLAHSDPLFYQTKILRLRDIYRYCLGIHMFRRHREGDIAYPSHHYETRTRNLAIPQFQRLAQCQRSLCYNGPVCWNGIPLAIRSATSLSLFKKRYKDYLLTAYILFVGNSIIEIVIMLFYCWLVFLIC